MRKMWIHHHQQWQELHSSRATYLKKIKMDMCQHALKPKHSKIKYHLTHKYHQPSITSKKHNTTWPTNAYDIHFWSEYTQSSKGNYDKMEADLSVIQEETSNYEHDKSITYLFSWRKTCICNTAWSIWYTRGGSSRSNPT